MAMDNELEEEDIHQFHFRDYSGLNDYLLLHPNKTQLAVVFCTDEWDISEDMSIPCKFEHSEKKMIMYSVMYNRSLDYDAPGFMDWKTNYPKHYLPLTVSS